MSNNPLIETYALAHTPERNLIAAIIIRAILDLRSPHDLIRREASMWLFSNQVDINFSFLWCMQALGLEGSVSELRKRLYDIVRDNRRLLYRTRTIFYSKRFPRPGPLVELPPSYKFFETLK